jgi:hypothetical protein
MTPSTTWQPADEADLRDLEDLAHLGAALATSRWTLSSRPAIAFLISSVSS